MPLRSEMSQYWADEGDDFAQIAPLPREWMDLSRFKVGDKIEYLKTTLVYFGPTRYGYSPHDPKEWKDMKGLIGVIVEVHNGYGSFARRDEHEGWLSVAFEYTPYRNMDGADEGKIALHPSGEGDHWRVVKG